VAISTPPVETNIPADPNLDGSSPPWSVDLRTQLQPGETPLAWFEPDLDQRLHYDAGQLCLTDRRLIARAPGDAQSASAWTSWPLRDLERVQAGHRGAAGRLLALGPTGLVASWHYTGARTAAAQQFAASCQAAIGRGRGLTADAGEGQGTICPTCGGAIPPGQSTCVYCAAPPLPPPGRSLWRLTRFARPRAGLIALGFGLMLVCTAAGLVPPYLTMPLLDEVLIPHQSTGAPLDYHLAGLYLTGLGSAAVLAWLLGWGRTYVMAAVS
jgi:ATP-binding cassette subfamily B protein